MRDNKSEKSTYNAFHAGVGFLGTKRIESNVIMGGIKIDYTSGKANFKNSFGTEIENKFKRIAGGPVLGYEHLFGGRFGVGGEFGLKFSSYTIKYEEEDEDAESTSFYTDSAVFVRMYF